MTAAIAPRARTLAEDRACPACRTPLRPRGDGLACAGCGRRFPTVAGMADLRLGPDRYLPLDAERAKAERLEEIAATTDLAGLGAAYYRLTEDVEPARASRYLAHLDRAESRGDAFRTLLPRSGRVLEVGCGSGGWLPAMARLGLRVDGVDIAARWLVLARKRLRESVGPGHVRLTAANAEALPWPDAMFDAVVADSVLEHLDDAASAWREWLRVTRPGGSLVVVSPNRFSVLPDPHVGLWGLGWLPRRWQRPYVRMRRGIRWPLTVRSAREAARMATSAGWSVRRVEAAPWPSARISGRAGRIVGSLYESLRRTAGSATLLRRIGPLWLLTAVREEGA